MARITSFGKQVIVFLLVMTLIIRPSFASTNLGGWSLGNPVVNGASAIVQGTKNALINGKNVVKTGTAIIAPNVAEVAKVLGKGVAGVALSVAVEQLLGAVDWVLDPDNNQIKYYLEPDDSTSKWIWMYAGKTFTTPQQTCSYYAQFYSKGGFTYTSNGGYLTSESTYTCNLTVKRIADGETWSDTPQVTASLNPNYNANAEREEKTLPLPTVAQQVISNAEAGDSDAKVAIGSAVADIISEAESDTTKARPIVNQLESSTTTSTNETATAQSTTTTTTTDTATNSTTSSTSTTDMNLTFPVFCGWAPIVCESAQVVISLPSTISEIWTEIKEEYFNKSEENTDTQLEIPDIPDQSIDSDISFGGSCPAPLSSQINFMGLNKTIEFSFDPVCQIASFIKPVVISISAFSAALIVAGIRTEVD